MSFKHSDTPTNNISIMEGFEEDCFTIQANHITYISLTGAFQNAVRVQDNRDPSKPF